MTIKEREQVWLDRIAEYKKSGQKKKHGVKKIILIRRVFIAGRADW